MNTPRTDKASKHVEDAANDWRWSPEHSRPLMVVPSDLARDIEDELSDANARIHALEQQLAEDERAIKTLRDEFAILLNTDDLELGLRRLRGLIDSGDDMAEALFSHGVAPESRAGFAVTNWKAAIHHTP